MGNQLFEYAAMKRIAIEENVGICTRFDDVWHVTLLDAFYGDFTTECARRPAYALEGESNYLQNERYFKEVSLRFRDDVLEEAAKQRAEVVVHVRLGDWDPDCLPPVEWVIDQRPDLVLTENPEHAYVRRIVRETGARSVHNSMAVDLAIMHLADKVIHTAGTFGWWGAYLSKNRSAAAFYGGPLTCTSWMGAARYDATGCTETGDKADAFLARVRAETRDCVRGLRRRRN